MIYIFLGVTAFLLLAVAWWRKPSALLPWTYLTVAGAITIGDLFVNAMFRMYIYRPGFFPASRDNYVGVLIAECLFLPAYYTFVTIFGGRYRYLVNSLAAIPIVLIEVLFLKLGVYAHRTWSLWYSLLGFPLFGLVTAYLAGSFEHRGYTDRHRLILIAAAMYFTMNIWGLVPIAILRLATMHLHLAKSPDLDLVLSSLLVHAVPFTLTGIVGTWFRWTQHPAYIVAVGTGFALWLTVLEYWGIWTGRWPWNPWLAGAFVSLVMAGMGWMDHWFSAHRPGRIPPWEPPLGTA